MSEVQCIFALLHPQGLRGLRSTMRIAASGSSWSPLIRSAFWRIILSTSDVVQLPTLSQTTFGGGPIRKLSCWKSPSFDTIVRLL